jgi:hypothetical protein
VTDEVIDQQIAALEATIEWLRGLKRVPDAPPVALLRQAQLRALRIMWRWWSFKQKLHKCSKLQTASAS